MPASAPSLMTAEEILVLDLPNKSTELVRGQLIVREPPSTYHGIISARLLYLISHHVYSNELGVVASQDTGFHIATDPDTVRAPDVAFVGRARTSHIPEHGYARLAPDLAVEVLSPGDRPGELLSKVGDWLDAGVRLVWVLDPARRQARVYRADGSVAVIAMDGELEGEEVLPRFCCALAEVFK
ncbi:MAG: Uma2 family endonuclease [Gemmatimonadaceae bacterium]